jgi:hypothetical protein
MSLAIKMFDRFGSNQAATSGDKNRFHIVPCTLPLASWGSPDLAGPFANHGVALLAAKRFGENLHVGKRPVHSESEMKCGLLLAISAYSGRRLAPHTCANRKNAAREESVKTWRPFGFDRLS